jgi:hypothetical protein
VHKDQVAGLCLAAGLLSACQIALVPPPPLPAGFPAVEPAEGQSYAAALREAPRKAAERRAEEKGRAEAREEACRTGMVVHQTGRRPFQCW